MTEPSKPFRVVLSMRRGWRMPPNTVSINRRSMWRNPYLVGMRLTDPVTNEEVTVRDKQHAVDLYRAWMTGWFERDPKMTIASVKPLQGRNLACGCKLGAPCHADVLLELIEKYTGGPKPDAG